MEATHVGDCDRDRHHEDVDHQHDNDDVAHAAAANDEDIAEDV